MSAFRIRRLRLVFLIFLLVPACDGNPVTEGGPNLSGRWIYRATDLRGTEVTCETSDVVLSLIQSPGSLQVDGRFDGSAFSFEVECTQGNRTATLLFTDGTDVLNGEIEDGVVAFDFGFPDFLHTGVIGEDSMGGTVAIRLDLTQSPLSQVGTVNLIGEWIAVRP